MSFARPYCLSIAGLDPTGGAGILADIKTFEQNNCMGLAVQTANTIQVEDKFVSINWINKKLVIDQLNLLLDRYKVKFVKVGLIHDISMLRSVLNHPKLEKAKVVWDPVLSASAGTDFKQDFKNFEEVISRLYMITPNRMEIRSLSKLEDELEGAKWMSQYTKVLLKGGHSVHQGKDILYDQGNVKLFNPKFVKYTEKHGTGCVFSSAIVANLAKGYPLQKTILKSKRYVEHILSSNQSLLAYHK